jgi:hypothetical protein
MAKDFTTKQMGDACEMLVAAEMTLAGVPALKVPDNWPGYDVIAQPRGAPPVRVSVKARTYKDGSDQYIGYYDREMFDWIGLVLCDVPGVGRRIYLMPRSIFEFASRSDVNSKYVRIDHVDMSFGAFKNNFRLLTDGLRAKRIEPLNRGRRRKTYQALQK